MSGGEYNGNESEEAETEEAEFEPEFEKAEHDGGASFHKSPMEEAIEKEETELEKYPPGFGMSFKTMDDAHYPAVMKYLREWVDWLRLEFAFTLAELPPCWFQHSDICYELYAMCAAEYKVWAGAEPTTMPSFALLPQLAGMRERIRGRCDRCNVAREHVPATIPQFVVDEDAWERQLKRVSSPSPAPTT